MIRICLIGRLALLLLPVVHAFIRVTPYEVQRLTQDEMSPTSKPSTIRLAMLGEEESEWYSPPQPATPTVPRGATPLIRELDGFADYLEFLTPPSSLSDDRLSIVIFYASWCKSCHKVLQQYKKLAMQFADYYHADSKKTLRHGSLRLAQLEHGKHTALCQQLGIVKLPTVHIYRNGENVVSFSCGPKKFHQLMEAVNDLNGQSATDKKTNVEMQELEAKGKQLKQVLAQTEGVNPVVGDQIQDIQSIRRVP
jgi:thiol-disulfide isomerase/thioredoxin